MEVENLFVNANQASFADYLSTFFNLLEYPSVVLLLAVLLEIVLPLSSSWRLSALKPLFAMMARKVNRDGNSLGQKVFSSVFLPVFILVIIFAILEFLRFIIIYDSLLSILLLPLLLESKPVLKNIVAVRNAIDDGRKDEGKKILQTRMIRDCRKLSQMGMYKAMSEQMAMSMFVNWFAILVWYMLLGVEGAVMMQAVAVMNRSFSSKEKKTELFGIFIMKLEHALLIPALVSFMLFMTFSFFYARILKNVLTHMKSYHDVISSVILDTMGSYANCSLGGPRYYKNEIVRFAKLGTKNDPTAKTPFKIFNKIRFTGVLFVCTCVLLKIMQILP